MYNEVFLSQLSSHSVSLDEPVPSHGQISIYKGSFQNYAATIKLQPLHPEGIQGQLEIEFQAIQSLSHPNILQLYDFFWVFDGTQYFWVSVSERCVKTLEKDIEYRQTNSYRCTEEGLWVIAWKLIEVFAHMQQRGIAHRNIKPASVYLMFNNEPKVGDFGSAIVVSDSATTVEGTLKYLSPILREAHVKGESTVYHNTFKSDVYSLGVILYELASLNTNIVLGNLAEMEVLVDRIPFSEALKGLLKTMLTMNEDNRPDFAHLHHPEAPVMITLRPQYMSQCVNCETSVNVQDERYLQCNHVFCSSHCFQTWRSTLPLSSQQCPICHMEIQQEYKQEVSVVAQTDMSAMATNPEVVSLVEASQQVNTGEKVAGAVDPPQVEPRMQSSAKSPILPRTQKNCWRKLCGCFYTSK